MGDYNDAVVVSTTFYDNSEGGLLRKDLAREFTKEVIGRDYPLVIVDGGTDDGNFARELKDLGAKVYDETQKGLGNSRREAVQYAYDRARDKGISILIWSEPEKVNFVDSLDYLVNQMEETGADLIVPSRKSMQNYPIAQLHSENFGNQRHSDNGYVDLGGNQLDTFFGPKVWRRDMTGYFQVFGNSKIIDELAEMRIEGLEKKYDASLSDEQKEFEMAKASKDLMRTDHMQHMPVCLMVLEGKDVLPVPVDYVHPKEQSELEERDRSTWNAKRLAQLTALDEQFRLVRRIHENGTLDEDLIKMLEEYR